MERRIRIDIPHERLEDFCRRHHIRRLSLFGSVLRDDFGYDSDVDVLVEFHEDHVPGLAFFSMQEELSGILGYPVDLNTAGFLNHRIREKVLAEAEELYVSR
jgi:predicted nucleotidyltransferase